LENKVNGNIEGVRRSTLEKMAQMYDLRMEDLEFVSPELAALLCEYTAMLNREVSVYISRDGRVRDVTIGDSRTARLPELRLTRNQDRLCGVRCIHTHPNGVGCLSEVDLGTLKTLKLDAMCALGVLDGRPGTLSAAFVDVDLNGEYQAKVSGPFPLSQLPHLEWLREIAAADARLLSTTVAVKAHEKEQAVLVGIETGAERYDSLGELAELAQTAGAEVVHIERQRRPAPDSAFYIGRGKAEELTNIGSAKEADLFIFDDELSAIQIRNLEEILGARVLDRTALILDIFAARAQSREGKLQVELAQMKYRLPRLIGLGQTLSRLGGGIGTRGPGEKKLEIDRRRIRRRIYELECDIKELEKQRALRRRRRERNAVPVCALVGYTNAGKSTLLNLLSGSDVLAEDMLFATLDPVSRLITLPRGTDVLLVDTVGFINKLPHDLVQAFRSTLEEALYADVLLHVVDASCEDYPEQMAVVSEVLSSLGAGDKPVITVYNKMDKIRQDLPPRRDTVCMSAKLNRGTEELLKLLEDRLGSGLQEMTLEIPYARGEVLSFLRSRGRISAEEYTENGTKVTFAIDSAALGMVRKMLGLAAPQEDEEE
jgi:GTP-binding protein HflX